MEIVKLQGQRRDVSTFVDPLLHQLQPPGSRVQRLGELPHLLLLRQRLQADTPQAGQGVARIHNSATWRICCLSKDSIPLEAGALFYRLFGGAFW